MNVDISIRNLTVEEVSSYKLQLVDWFCDAYALNFPKLIFGKIEGENRYQALFNYLQSGQGNVLGLLQNDNLLGFLWYFKTPTNRLHVNEIIISPAHRSSGYGKILLEELLAIGRDEGISQVELFVTCTNQVAVNFYEKYDFRAERMLMVKNIEHDANPLLDN